MSSNKQPKTTTPSDADLRGNPGIGSSKGTGAMDRTGAGDDLDGDTTFEGDVMNDATAGGGVDPDRRGRTNK